MDLTGKVALVTGGARGIGYSIAEALLQKGAKVGLVDVLVEKGEDAAKELNEKYGEGKAIFVQCDVTVEEDLKAAFEQVINKLGSLSIVANNAGIARHTNWRKLIDVNLVAVVNGVMLGFKYMGKGNGGSGGTIINTASVLGLKPMAEVPVYSATKHGVVGLTRSFGLPLHFNKTAVAVKAICPSAVFTDMIRESKVDTEFLKEFPPVEVSVVAEGFIKLLTEGENGAVMHISTGGFKYIDAHKC